MSAAADDEIELAELQRALLDDRTLDDLLADIETLCTLEGVALKHGADVHAETSSALGIADVRPALARGAAVQLRYAYNGERWCDTLLPGMSETLLVRMRDRK